MLRRSTSFDTRPMPMKMAMKRPKTAVAASPRSLMILTSWPGRQLPEKERRRDQQDGEDHEVVGHAVPDRLAEDAEGDAANRAHATPPAIAGRADPAAATRLTKKSSSVSLIGWSETRLAPAAMRSASTRSGGGSVASSIVKRPGEISDVAPRAPAPARASTSRRHAGDDQFPAAHLERQDVADPAGRRQAAAGDDGDAAAERLGVGEDVRAEEHRPALVAQPQDQVPDLPAPEGIEPGHRLVEKDDLGIVDERLRDPDALHHPLRELAQLQPSFGADADLVEQRATRASGARRRRSRRAGRNSRATPPPSGSRRSRGSPAGSRCAAAWRRGRPAGRESRPGPRSERSAASAASASSSCRRRWARGSRRPRPVSIDSDKRSSARYGRLRQKPIA